MAVININDVKFEMASSSSKNLEDISRLIKKALSGTLKKFYPSQLINFFISKNTPAGIKKRQEQEIDYFIARSTKKIIGVIGLSKRKNQIRSLYIDSEYSSQLAQKLIDFILIEANKRNYKKVMVSSNPYNKKFYEDNGFIFKKKVVKRAGKMTWREFFLEKDLSTHNFFWAIESRKLIFRSEILIYPEILESLKNLRGKKIKILDAGCGTGKLCERLLNLDPDFMVYGIDKSRQAVKLAKSNNDKIDYRVGRITSLREYYKKESFDIVISTFVTLYLKEAELLEFLREVFYTLKSNGLFILADVHPFLPITQPKTRWEKWTSANLDYFKAAKVKQKIFLPKDKIGNDTEPFDVEWMHHPFFSYLNKMISVGFSLERLEEPKPNKDILKKYKKMWGEEIKTPVYFILHMRRQ